MDEQYYLSRINHLFTGIGNGSLCKRDARKQIDRCRRKLEKLRPDKYCGISKYIVTGVDRNGKRFKKVFEGNAAGFMMCRGINVWRGSKWFVNKAGRKILMQRIWN